ncbi:hypothetical protein N0V93_008245 [Gnomoniopsis smithogilvyi]|uniref:BTB domain-containing protein n=1 Tax=Gnomoniopsis smithogilvyi TaxID=1191159 RepID=A0A9W9CUK2_9PEZI|nr:hypothetical protein N0V93_008245 [Gnomoniopsis smithogilvyi]
MANMGPLLRPGQVKANRHFTLSMLTDCFLWSFFWVLTIWNIIVSLTKYAQEAKTRKINIDNVDPEVMDTLIRYIYTEELPPEELSAQYESIICLKSNAQLFIQADYFLLSQLQDDSLGRLKAGFCKGASQLCSLLLAWRSDKDIQPVMETAYTSTHNFEKFQEDLCQAVKLAYSVRTVRELHKTVIAFVIFMRDQISTPKLEKLTNDVPEFEADLQKTLLAVSFDRNFRAQVGLKTRQETARARHTTRRPLCHVCKLYQPRLLVTDPLPEVEVLWCKPCSAKGLAELLDKLVQAMPLT